MLLKTWGEALRGVVEKAPMLKKWRFIKGFNQRN